jgi:hypothetical protein
VAITLQWLSSEWRRKAPAGVRAGFVLARLGLARCFDEVHRAVNGIPLTPNSARPLSVLVQVWSAPIHSPSGSWIVAQDRFQRPGRC